MSLTSFEVEIKIAIRDPEELERKLIDIGAVRTNQERQTDIYFNHPCRSFELTDEALRLREREMIQVSMQSTAIPTAICELTYKGPKLDGMTKTRLELSAEIQDTKSLHSILTQLGYQEVATITKERIFFGIEDIIVSIDHVQHVGTFLEVEKVVSSADLIPETREGVLSFLERLGLKREDSIRESYLELFLRKQHT